MFSAANINPTIKWLVATFAVAVLALSGLFSLQAQAASTNDVIYGGVSSVADLKNKFNNGDGRNSAASIQKIFKEAVGVTNASQFDGMVSGYIYRDGRIVVGSEVVATDAYSTGRSQFRDSKPLGNTGAYYEKVSVRFASTTERAAAFIKMVDGEFKFAVQKSCGNPTWATEVPQPEFVCKSLEASVTGGTFPLEVDFTAREEVKNTEVTGYLWDFDGDGQTDRTTTERTTSYTYQEAGEFKATVRIRTADGTEQQVQTPCQATITVSEEVNPAFRCESLVITNDSDDLIPRRVDFLGQSSVTDSSVVGYTYVILDADGEEVERERIDTDELEVEFSYLFEDAGDYTVYLLVHTADGDTERVNDCEVSITAEEEQPEEKGEEQPPELPKTGIFSATAGVAGTTGLWVGARKWLESRRKLIQSLMNK